MKPPGRTKAGFLLATGFSFFLAGFMVVSGPVREPRADPAADVILGEACFMAGDLDCAGEKLGRAAESGQPNSVPRALYLLGRVHLLTGDYRQSKEYFERAAEADPRSAGRWMALVGIGDALLGAGRPDEAVRRYRFALAAVPADVNGAVVEVKIALCLHRLGRVEEAARFLGEAFTRIPLLSGWAGREEDFFRSVDMMGPGPFQGEAERFVILLGPVEGEPDLDPLVGPEVPVGKFRKEGRVFIEIGPLDDLVQAMILSESLKSAFPFPLEIVKR